MAEEKKQADKTPTEAPADQAEDKPAPAADGKPAPAADEKPAEKPAEETSRAAPPPPEGKHYFWGTGRRKTAVARVRIRPGSGEFTVNKRPAPEFFPSEKDRRAVFAPLQAAKMARSWDVFVNIRGGGMTGQAGAISMGLARALVRAVPFGEGCIDYEAFFRGLVDGGFDGIANFEMCSPLRGGGDEANLDRCATRYLTWMRQHVAKC